MITPQDKPTSGDALRWSSAPRLFVFERFDPTEKSLEWLRERGVELTLGYAMWETPFWRHSEDQLIAKAKGHVGLMGASGTRITRRVIESLPELRFVSKFGIGVDSIDIDAATEHGVAVTNTPEESQVTTVCEHAIAMMLALQKQFPTWTQEFMRKGGWRGTVYALAMLGATVGIVGLGRIGRGVAQRLSGWGTRILAYDPYVREAPEAVTLTDLDSLLERSDIVTLHASPSAENRKLIGRAALARMKPTALLINTGRGWLVDYAALREALAAGRIAGAAIDVYESEPPDPADPLFTLPNVLCTPHIGAWTYDGTQNVGWHGARNAWALLSGEGHADVVNPEALARARVRAAP